ncbi:MAG TPA: dienelactone hydrolase family protein [Syntrophales bacterium]|nr:dienelactone hydrolase family protein [Syntrophales bacterium]
MHAKLLIMILSLFVSAHSALGAVRTEPVAYRDGDVRLEGWMAYDDEPAGKQPGIIVVHEWWGINDYIKKRAEQMAGLGYVVFAVDIYGKDTRPKDQKEAAEASGRFSKDRELLRRRAGAGLDVLRRSPRADAARIAAVGYCFGGMTVLEMARSGADLAGVVSFHGVLETPRPEDARKIKGSVLVLHGADDPFVPLRQVNAFINEMQKGGVDWQMNIYGGVVHSFTNPASGEDRKKGLAYDEKADRRSWEAMKSFLEEVLGKGRRVK